MKDGKEEKPEIPETSWVAMCGKIPITNETGCVLFIFSDESLAVKYGKRIGLKVFSTQKYSREELKAKFSDECHSAILDLTGSGRDFIEAIAL